jgi:hypothetical protein
MSRQFGINEIDIDVPRVEGGIEVIIVEYGKLSIKVEKMDIFQNCWIFSFSAHQSDEPDRCRYRQWLF